MADFTVNIKKYYDITPDGLEATRWTDISSCRNIIMLLTDHYPAELFKYQLNYGNYVIVVVNRNTGEKQGYLRETYK